MTGIGVRDALQGIPRALAEVLGAFKSDEGSEHKPLVVAVDTPSGIGVDDAHCRVLHSRGHHDDVRCTEALRHAPPCRIRLR